MDTKDLHNSFICSYGDTDDDLVEEGRRRALIKMSEAQYMQLYYSNPDLMPKRLQQLYYYNSDIKKLEEKKYYLVTINFPPVVNLPDVKNVFSVWKDLAYVDMIRYSWEFTTEEGSPSHPHCHCLVRKSCQPSHFVSRTYSTFKNYLGSKQSIDLKSIKEKDKDKVLGYIAKDRPSDVALCEIHKM